MNIEKQEKSARQKLNRISQEHILKYWNELSHTQQEELLRQIELLDVALFKSCRALLKKQAVHRLKNFHPFEDYAWSGNKEDDILGERILKQGKAACLILAGGQGTRLHFNAPKGMFPISTSKNKSLFQLIAEKTVAASKLYERELQIAIMTSSQNKIETIRFFEQNDFFGLSSTQVSFFSQGLLPLLDTQGDLFLEAKGSLSMGPDGNGSCLKSFMESPIFERWKERGIEIVNLTLIDNPLADPFDSNLIGFHARRNNDVTIKGIERKDPQENVGVIVQKDGHPAIVEYSEIDEAEKTATHPNGTLKHRLANISLFCFSFNFLQKAAALTMEMPFHLAFKAVKMLDSNENPQGKKQPNAWKFERFIFDSLPLASKISALVYPRALIFSPLKNFEGTDSPETVKRDLQNRDRLILQSLTGGQVPSHTFELSQDFYYPTLQLKQKWKGQEIPLLDYYDANS